MVFNVAFSWSLAEIFGMIAYLQMFVFMPLIEIDFPLSCMIIYERLIKVATFDLLMTDEWFP